jgi:hypothetical protein
MKLQTQKPTEVRRLERETLKGTSTYYCVTDWLKSHGIEKASAITDFFRVDKVKRDVLHFESKYNLDFDLFKKTLNGWEISPIKNQRQSIRGALNKADAASMFSEAGRNGGTYMHEIVYVWFREWASAEFNIQFHEASLVALKEKAESEAAPKDVTKTLEWKAERQLACRGAKHFSGCIQYRYKTIEGGKKGPPLYAKHYNRLNELALGDRFMGQFRALLAASEKRKKESVREFCDLDQLSELNHKQALYSHFMADGRMTLAEVDAEMVRAAEIRALVMGQQQASKPRYINPKGAEIANQPHQPSLF